jgi:meso-butanediol dehydrogenase/(S,S)-butanediol dehydrogenase/diacetyl reductase
VGRLDGKVALISGTAGGMGRAAALEFAAKGARVFGCDVQPEAQAETERLVRDAGGTIDSLTPVDLSAADGAQAWIDAAVARFGRIDVLYNNASRLRLGPFGEQPFEDWAFTIDNELHLPYHCTRAAWPQLIAAGGGVVINVGSVAAIRGAAFAPMSAHGAAKAGVLSFTRHLCAAGADHGIRAVSISPDRAALRRSRPPHRGARRAHPVAAYRRTAGRRPGGGVPRLRRRRLHQRREHRRRRRRERDGRLRASGAIG